MPGTFSIHNQAPHAPRGTAPPSHTPSSTAASSLKPRRPEHVLTDPEGFAPPKSQDCEREQEGTLQALIYGGEDEASEAALVWPL